MRRTLAILSLLSAVSLGACGGDGTGPSGSSTIVGTWNATAIVAAPVSNPSATENLYAEGFRLKFVFASNKSYTIVSSFPGEAPDTSDGTYVQAGSSLTLTSAGDNEVTPIDLTVNGNTATLVVSGVTFDFGAGEVPARMTVTARRD